MPVRERERDATKTKEGGGGEEEWQKDEIGLEGEERR